MHQLTQKDLTNFSASLQDLYKTCSLEDLPARLLSVISNNIPAVDYTYATLSFQKHNSTVIGTQAAPDHDPLDIADFEQIAHQHFYEHPLVAHYLRTGDYGAHKLSDFVNQRQLHCLEGLYGKLMQPRGAQDMIAVSFPIWPVIPRRSRHERNDIIAITLLGEQVYTERDRFIFNLLHPHLLQAQQNMEQFAKIQQDWVQQRRTLDRLGIIALDGDGKVQLISQQAGRWLKQYFQAWQSATQALPDHLQRWIKYRLLSSGTNPDEMPSPHSPLKLEQAGRQLVVRFVVEQPGEQYLLLLEEQQVLSLSAASLKLLGLTKRETEVLFEVTQGKTNPEIAATLSLSVGTIRKYLEYIYAKLGVQTRSEAVVFALRQLGALN